MNLYCTLERAKQQGKFGSGSATDLEDLKFNIGVVSRRIDRIMHDDRQVPYFVPTVDTLEFPLTSSWLRSSGLVFSPGIPIQAVTEVTLKWRQHSEELTSFIAVDANKRLEWVSDSSSFGAYVYHYGDGCKLEITGTFGWSNAWLDSGDTVEDDPLTSSATTLTVNDVDASSLLMTGQRFEYGSIIRVEDEIMHVRALDTTLNTLTVLRGQNGTTAAAHVQNTMIEVLDIPEPIQHVTARQAGLLYTRRGAFQQVTTGLDGTTTIYPQDLLSELRAVLAGYAV